MVRKILYLNHDMSYRSRRHHVSMDVRQQRRPLNHQIWAKHWQMIPVPSQIHPK
jgi:hypothetical protein